MSKKGFLYFTLGEVVSLEDDTWYPNSSSDINFSTIMTTHSLVIEEPSQDKTTILVQLMRMVYARYYDCDVYRKELAYPYYQDANAPSSSERKDIFRRFVALFNITAPRYIPLLQQFENNKSNPIAPVSSTSTGATRFNDTPQDGGEFDDDGHTTHITQSTATTTTDVGSVMERLDSLYKNWRSILREWSNEFKCLFYTGGI